MSRELTACQLIERSINKKFRKELWSPFVAAVKRYELIQSGDKIAVCISGGKDSMLMAKLMQELQRHSDVPFELVFLVMDPGYNEINRRKIESNAALLEIPVTIFETDVFAVANSAEQNPCYLCARMRRGHLYSKAQSLGCNKIALGHHRDDVVETVVMSMFYASQLQSMPPKLHSANFPGMQLIRPMYCIREEDILAWKRYNDLEFIQCACRFTENCTLCDNGGGSKRQEIKTLLRRLSRDNPDLHTSIFSQLVLAQYLQDNDVDAHIEKTKELYRAKANLMMDCMRKYLPEGVTFTPTEGGMFLWATLPDRITTVDLYRAALAKGVAICPGDPFYEIDRGVHTVRLNYSNSTDEIIEKGMKLLGEACAELLGK